ncbi:MAG: SRPBCC family protein [Dehalococcoidia bacterium]
MVIKNMNWVDVENGYIDRNIFFDEEIYRQELEQVFARSWLFVGHESMIPNPGDFTMTTMGEDPVIVTRASDMTVHVLLNSCRHRGNAVTRANIGNCSSFMCAYHGWTYDLKGELIAIPGFKELYHEDLDMKQWGLIRCPNVESFHGLLFANWDPSAPGLVEYMGEYAWFLETRVNPQGKGSELNGGIFKWTMDHNWKFAADNFVGDGYHGPISHQSAILAGHTTASIQTTGRTVDRQRDPFASFQNQSSPDAFRIATKYGHGAGLTLREKDSAVAPEDMPPDLKDYYEQRRESMEKLQGQNRARLGGFNAMFPNFSINSSADQIHVWHPRGPLLTESWVYVLVDKAAPQSVKDELVKESSRRFGPTGMFEQDDSDNWRLSTGGAKSIIGRRYPLHYAMGLRQQNWMEAKEDLPLRRQGNLGDTNQLNFYRHWQDLMMGKSWQELQEQPFDRV